MICTWLKRRIARKKLAHPSDAGRALSLLGHEQQRSRVREVAASMRAAKGLAPHPALTTTRENKHV